MFRKLWFLIAVSILAVLAIPAAISQTAVADEGTPYDPTSISIESVRIYQNLWQTGDQLYVVEYKVMYNTTPLIEPKDVYLVGIWDGAVLRASEPLKSYGYNVTSIYLNAPSALNWE